MATPRVIVIAQARMGSSRLPGKVLRRAGDRSLLEHLVRRLQRSREATDLIIATTTDPGDEPLVGAARALGCAVHRGSVDDVLDRYHAAIESLGADPGDLVVRVTGDCPLLDPAELDRLVTEFIARRGTPSAVEYLTNQAGERRRIPRGLDVEVFEVAGLQRAAREASLDGDREHVTPYFYRVAGRFATAVSDPPGPDLGHLRLTVDTPADLALVDAVVRALGDDARTEAIASWLAAHPEVAALNADVRQKGLDSDMQARAARVLGRRLLARADAGGTTGFGHVTRVGALLDAWVALGGRATLVGRGVVGSVRDRLLAYGVELVEGDDAQFDARVDTADALVVDGYAFGREHQARWQARRPLLAIDDLAAHEQLADLVVNQILDFDPQRYRVAAWTRLLVGHPYVLLRQEFREQPAAPLAGGDRRRIILTFGGTDPAQLSEPFVRALLEIQGPDQLDLIMGKGQDPQARAQLEALAATHEQLEIHVDVREMAAMLAGASVCVCAAGTTVWEAMASGVPVVCVAAADNQRPVIAGIDRLNAGVSLGWHGDLDFTAAARTIQALLANPTRLATLATKGSATVDGRGVYRVLDALLDVVDRRAAP
ncbi:acylneuraminate cytidylyltransferase [Enhygromyxa salina]|uniref:Acylneuraminate cytidylyltransferase n=1 Tax=Enhygromyxa salina TaxID=215803 RepID=A0A0C2CWH4_9BACT|nr:UDP-2,4-diacetamido-2,4,6-trideoxy-beta-L-altropyranose hydrolase [Enhygromyxa salina]KIG13970.1 acylneuraminate cytidylyltransferase [Enhygromyxa salina]